MGAGRAAGEGFRDVDAPQPEAGIFPPVMWITSLSQNSSYLFNVLSL